MSGPRDIARSFAALIAATLVLAMIAAVTTLAIGTTFLEFRQRAVSVDGSAPVARPVSDASADADVTTPGTAVHLQMPTSLSRTGGRQVRVTLTGERLTADDARRFVEVSFTSDDRRVDIVPRTALLARDRLHDARFSLAARPDVECGENFDGELHVTVRPLASSAAPLVAQAPLPRLACAGEFPDAPETIHVTEAVCGPDHAEQAQRVLDGESLDPQLCEPERWEDGEWQEPQPDPPPTSRRRGSSGGEARTAADDGAEPATDAGSSQEDADADDDGDDAEPDEAEDEDTERDRDAAQDDGTRDGERAEDDGNDDDGDGDDGRDTQEDESDHADASGHDESENDHGDDASDDHHRGDESEAHDAGDADDGGDESSEDH